MGPGLGKRIPERLGQRLGRLDPLPGNPEAMGQRHPVRGRPRQIGEGPRSGPRLGGAGSLQLDLQDAVGAVGAEQRHHVETLAGLGPQRLQRVGGAPVGLEGDHRPVRTREGGARGERQSGADGAPRERQHRMRRRGAGGAEPGADAGEGLVHDDGAFGLQGREREAEADRVEGAFGNRRSRRCARGRAGRSRQGIGQAFERGGDVVLRTRKHERRAAIRQQEARQPRVAEEGHRRARSCEQQRAASGERGQRLFREVGQPLQRRASGSALDASGKGLAEEPGAACSRNAAGSVEGGAARASGAEQEHRVAIVQRPRRTFDRFVRDRRGARRAYRRADRRGLLRLDVVRHDQAHDGARRRQRRLDGARGCRGDSGRVFAAQDCIAEGACEGADVGSQQRIVGQVPARMLADHVQQRRSRTACVVQVGTGVGQPGAQVQQREGRSPRHARVAVGGAAAHALEEAEDGTQTRSAVEGGHQRQLGGAGIGEADVDSSGSRRAHQRVGSVHGTPLHARVARLDEPANGCRERRARMGPTIVLAMAPALTAELFDEPLLARLARAGEVPDARPLASFGDARAETLLPRAEVLLTSWGCPPIDERVLVRAPRLRAIVHAAGTVKQHVTQACFDRGLAISSAAAANALPVAEYTLAAILFANKQIFRLRDRYREFRSFRLWSRELPGLGNYRKRVGLVGASRIGRRVLELLAPFDLEPLLFDPYVDEAEARALGAEKLELDELLSRSDIVSLHAPALPETRHLLDARRLALLRDGATLINTARGALVEGAALERELVSGRIDAIIDTTEPEILPADSPLYVLPNVFLTPHVAGSLGSETRRMADLAVGEVERFARGEPLRYAIRADELARTA